MPGPWLRDELIVGLDNTPGALAHVLKLLGDAGVNARALCGYTMGPEKAAVHIIPDDPAKARATLDDAKVKYDLSPCLIVPADDKPGAVAALTAKIAAAGVNIEHCYATSAGKGALAGTVVFRTSDNVAAKAAIA